MILTSGLPLGDCCGHCCTVVVTVYWPPNTWTGPVGTYTRLNPQCHFFQQFHTSAWAPVYRTWPRGTPGVGASLWSTRTVVGLPPRPSSGARYTRRMYECPVVNSLIWTLIFVPVDKVDLGCATKKKTHSTDCWDSRRGRWGRGGNVPPCCSKAESSRSWFRAPWWACRAAPGYCTHCHWRWGDGRRRGFGSPPPGVPVAVTSIGSLLTIRTRPCWFHFPKNSGVNLEKFNENHN